VLAQRAASEGPHWMRAMEDHSAPIPEERTSKLGGIIRSLIRRVQSKATLATPPNGRQKKNTLVGHAKWETIYPALKEKDRSSLNTEAKKDSRPLLFF